MTAFEDGAACPNKSPLYAYLVGKGLLAFFISKKGCNTFQHVGTSGLEKFRFNTPYLALSLRLTLLDAWSE